MKLLNKLGILALFAFAFTACVDQDPEIQTFPDPDVDFTYEVAGGDTADYKLDYYVVSAIQFKNTSSKTGDVAWNFGAAANEYEILNDDINNPIVKFKTAGLYNVTLTIGGVGTRTYPILIYDIVPKMWISEQSMELVELNECKVSFDLRLPNPENKVVKYTWTFPKDAKVNGQSLVNDTISFYSDSITGLVECPKNVTFSHLGSQQVKVDALFDVNGKDKRPLEQSYINVQVASPFDAPTLYYAQVGGNIKAIKLFTDEQLAQLNGVTVYPYDMGVPAGDNPFNLLYGANAAGEHWIYILDAGKQYYYINDEAGVLGDGKITAMRTNGTDVNTVISNVGGPAFSDPFQGFLKDGYIYYNDRNRGFSKIGMNERGLVEGKSSDNFRASYVTTNEQLGYYNAGIVYGAISNGLYLDNENVFWWGKNYNGVGLYRFKESHVGTGERPYGVLLSGMQFTSYTLDEVNKKLYVWAIGGSTPGSGFVEYPLPPNTLESTLDPVKGVTKYISMDAKPVNTTADERVFVKQMVIDSRNGRVFFGFRAEAGDSWSTNWKNDDPKNVNNRRGTGLVFYDPAAGEDAECKVYGETLGEEILGVTINPNPTKLF